MFDRYFIWGLIERNKVSFDVVFSPDTWITYQHLYDLWQLVNLESTKSAWEAVEQDKK